MVIDPKILKRLNLYEKSTHVAPCTWEGRDAAVGVSLRGLAFAAASGFNVTSSQGPFRAASLTMTSESTAVIEIYGSPFSVTFPSEDIAKELLEEVKIATASAGGSPPLVLGPNERIVKSCSFLSGAYLPLSQGDEVELVFRELRLEIYRGLALAQNKPLHVMWFDKSFTVDLSGPGQVTSGGGFVGGGSGLVGGAEGIAIASVLNRLTTKSSIISVLKIADDGHEGFFLHTEQTPVQLRQQLSPVFVRLRQQERQLSSAGPDDFIGRLERLVAMHRAGALTDTEFATAKTALLQGLG
ncbi:hypothetical protein ABIB25_005646 [Nakamurella sp. UYEF19]|uniref:hypothetical protein n=1 Tax=Nakamurella sp. UYEF19 TaxID=1756392 RepID=UPI003390A666